MELKYLRLLFLKKYKFQYLYETMWPLFMGSIGPLINSFYENLMILKDPRFLKHLKKSKMLKTKIYVLKKGSHFTRI